LAGPSYRFVSAYAHALRREPTFVIAEHLRHLLHKARGSGGFGIPGRIGAAERLENAA